MNQFVTSQYLTPGTGIVMDSRAIDRIRLPGSLPDRDDPDLPKQMPDESKEDHAWRVAEYLAANNRLVVVLPDERKESSE